MLNLFAQSYTYTTTTVNTAPSSGMTALFVIYLLAVFVFVALVVVGMWRLFEKAGEKGWKSLIPVYNTWILFELSGKPGWWALISLIPYVGSLVAFVLYCIAMVQLAKNFSKTTTFAIFGMIIFPFVGFLILGFGKDKYVGKKYVSPSSTPSATPVA